MNFRVGNIFRELSYSLRRNPSLFIGTLGAIAISLLILGSAFVVREAVSNATQRWADGVEFIVFLNPDASQIEIDAINAKISANPEIAGASFVNKQQAFDEFNSLFQDSEQMRQVVSVDDMPPSFRVVPLNTDSTVVEALADGFRADPGVFEVVAAIDTIEAIEKVGDRLNNGFLLLGVILLIAATLLVYNTIRTTIFSRRREIEVMRLVGASNWYIRIPFMFEGVLQGLFAGLVTFFGYREVNNFLASLGEDENLTLLEGLRAPEGDVFTIWVAMIIVRVVTGAIASAIALSRYLDV